MEELPELMYSRLREGKLPKVYPVKPYRIKAKARLRNREYSRSNVLNKIRSTIRPLSFLQPVRIEDARLVGYRATYQNAYISVYGDELSFIADFRNTTSRPVTAECRQSVDGKRSDVTVFFMRHAPYRLEIKYVVEEPKEVSQIAEVKKLIFIQERITHSYPIGLLDDRDKPVAEYPVPNVDNAVLDIAYSFSVTNLIYPLPLPDGLSIKDMSVNLVSGFLLYEGKLYKDPLRDNTVTLRWTLVNNTGSILTVSHWGLPLTVLYEDNRHVSQIDVDVTISDRTISTGNSTTYSFNFNLPDFCYGKVAAAHAVEVWRSDVYGHKLTPIYFGGPLLQFEVGRLRLP